MISEDSRTSKVETPGEILGRPVSEYTPAQLANIMASDNIAISRLDEFGPFIFRELAFRLGSENLRTAAARNLYRFFMQRQTPDATFPDPDASPRILSLAEKSQILITPRRSLQSRIANKMRSLADALEQGLAGSATRYCKFADQIAIALAEKK